MNKREQVEAGQHNRQSDEALHDAVNQAGNGARTQSGQFVLDLDVLGRLYDYRLIAHGTPEAGSC